MIENYLLTDVGADIDMFSFKFLLFTSFWSMVLEKTLAVPPDACFANFRWDDCGLPAKPVMYYYKSGSRCEVGLWKGCLPNQNMFEDEYECVRTCIFVDRAGPEDYHEIHKVDITTEEPERTGEPEETKVEETTGTDDRDSTNTDNTNLDGDSTDKGVTERGDDTAATGEDNPGVTEGGNAMAATGEDNPGVREGGDNTATTGEDNPGVTEGGNDTSATGEDNPGVREGGDNTAATGEDNPGVTEGGNTGVTARDNTGYKLDPRTGSSYKFHNVNVKWAEAGAACREEQAYLAVINNDTESQVLKELFPKNVTKRWAHVGFHKENGVWQTIFGQTFEEAGFGTWGEGQPNSFNGSELCGTILKIDGHLNDYGCDSDAPFICEKTFTIP